MTGENYRPLPLDFQILEELPDKGVLGGVHWAGRPLKHVRISINEHLPEGFPPVAMSVIQARTRSMKLAGLVEDFPATSVGLIWARTAAGVEVLATKAEVLGS